MAAPTHKVQSILWPVLEDRCDTRGISGENDSTMAQITGLYAGSGKKLSLSISWENLLSLVAAFGQVGLVLRSDTSIHEQGKEETQAAHCVSGGTPSLPSVLCVCDSSSSFSPNTAMLNQGIPKLVFTQPGKRRGRE